MDEFCTLHSHNSFSFFDGLDVSARSSPYVASLGQPAMALTNHGNIFGLVDHHRQCKEVGVKPIHGVELYLTETEEKPADKKFYHQTVLVENTTGYRNLMRLVTKSYELFYYKPRVTLDLLERYGEGLIVLSGCPSSMIHRAMQDEDEERARKLFLRMRRSFGDRFYAELQHHPVARPSARWLVDLANRHGVPVVATNDAHYVEAQDKPVHDFVLGTRHKGRSDEGATYGEGFHLLSREEFAGILRKAHPWMKDRAIADALSETVRIADRVTFEFEKPERMLPALWGDDSAAALRRAAAGGMMRRGLHAKKEYVARLRREVEVIEKLGYVDYFHVVREVTTWARENGVLVGPRGSVCGSLLAYCIGVTPIDPILHGILFERFLHEQKTAVPDVDLDIDSENRGRLQEWLLERYKPHAYRILAFGRSGPGTIAKDLREALPDIDPGLFDDLKSELNEMRWVHHIEVPSEEDLRKVVPSINEIEEDAPWVVRCVSRLVGAVRYVGQHPGGICFVSDDPMRWIALVRKPGEDGVFTSYSHMDVSHLGLLKFDFLGLAAMATLNNAVRMIRERHGDEVDLEAIPLDDKKSLREFSRGNTDGVFQFETPGARSILRQIEPETFVELVASTALNRPGVSANLESYVKGKELAAAGYEHEGVFASTYGAVVYQEQIVTILRDLGLDWRDADVFLKAIKSHTIGYNVALKAQMGVDILDKIKEQVKAVRGVTDQEALEFVDSINQYSFNRAHAVGYTVTAYQMMWLRLYYPMEFWVSSLNNEGVEAKRWAYERAAIWDGLMLLPPHVNGSVRYSIEDNVIRVGLTSLKNVGEKAAEAIVAAGPYERAVDIKRVPKRAANAGVVRALVKGGALIMDEEKWRKHAVAYNVMRKEAKLGGWQFKGRS